MDENEVRIIVREMIPEILEAVKYPISEFSIIKAVEAMAYQARNIQNRTNFIDKFLKDNPNFLLYKELILETINEFQSKYLFRSIDEIVADSSFKDEINNRIRILQGIDTTTKDKPTTDFIGAL
jgi:hypothetical protein